jgi:hypothetical protein
MNRWLPGWQAGQMGESLAGWMFVWLDGFLDEGMNEWLSG